MDFISVSDFIDYNLFTRKYSVSAADDWPILTLLAEREGNTIKGKKKLAKELFMVVTNSSIETPFEFKKFPQGPYDRKIDKSIERLERKGYIKQRKKKVYKNNPWIEFILSPKGKDFYKKNIRPKLSEFPEFLKSFRSIENLHKTGKDLSDYCYKDFILKDKDTEESLWMEQRKNWVNKIRKRIDGLISTRFKKHITRDMEYELMMPVQYCKDIINNGKFDPSNEETQVESGVVLKTMEKILNKVEYVIAAVNSKNPDISDPKIKSNLNYLDRHFYFLNEYCHNLGIWPSLYDENTEPSDFLPEENVEFSDRGEGKWAQATANI